MKTLFVRALVVACSMMLLSSSVSAFWLVPAACVSSWNMPAGETACNCIYDYTDGLRKTVGCMDDGRPTAPWGYSCSYKADCPCFNELEEQENYPENNIAVDEVAPGYW